MPHLWSVTIDEIWKDESIYCTFWCSAWVHFTLHDYTRTIVNSYVCTAVAWETGDVSLLPGSELFPALATNFSQQQLTTTEPHKSSNNKSRWNLWYDRHSASLFCWQAPVWGPLFLLLLPDRSGFVNVFLKRGRVCSLQLLIGSPVHSFLRPSPSGIMTIFYCLKFENPPAWRIYLYLSGTGLPSCKLRHWVSPVPFYFKWPLETPDPGYNISARTA